MRRHTLEMTPTELADVGELANFYWGFNNDLPGVRRQEVVIRENSRSLEITIAKALLDSCLPERVKPMDLVGHKVAWEVDPITGNLVLDLNGAISGNGAVWE